MKRHELIGKCILASEISTPEILDKIRFKLSEMDLLQEPGYGTWGVKESFSCLKIAEVSCWCNLEMPTISVEEFLNPGSLRKGSAEDRNIILLLNT